MQQACLLYFPTVSPFLGARPSSLCPNAAKNTTIGRNMQQIGFQS